MNINDFQRVLFYDQKAGLYVFSIVCNHIFQDGNKRTGLQAAIIFLLTNGDGFAEFVDDLLIRFTPSVASAEQPLAWFQEYSRAL